MLTHVTGKLPLPTVYVLMVFHSSLLAEGLVIRNLLLLIMNALMSLQTTMLTE
jgi:hypothetical protein